MPSSSESARPRLVAAMIVGNDAEALPSTLESLRPLADGVVLYDIGSQAATADVAKRYAARLERWKSTDDDSAARNRCFRLIRSDWLLWMEPGETIAPAAAARLRSLVDARPSTEAVYLLMVCQAAGRMIERQGQPRLLPNRGDLWFEGRGRPRLQPAIECLRLAVEVAPGQIDRPVRWLDPGWRKSAAQRRLSLVTDEARDRGSYTGELLLDLGECYADSGDPNSARSAFQQAIQRCRPGSTARLSGYYGLLGALAESEHVGLRTGICLQALAEFPLDAQLLVAMGECLHEQQRFDLAARSFEAAVRHGELNLETWHLPELAELAAHCWVRSLELCGQRQDARRALDESLQLHPHSARLLRKALDTAVEANDESRATTMLGRLGLDPLAAQAAACGAAMAMQGRWAEAIERLTLALATAANEPFCLRWLAVALLSDGAIDEAREVLTRWQHVEPDHPQLQSYLRALGSPQRRLRVDAEQPPASALPRALGARLGR